ncbi:MAG: hypothetical protein SNJ81_03535 [Cyanobacteriota bacterium]
MLFSANILMSVLCSISLGLGPISSFVTGLLLFFILNLIPHATPEHKNTMSFKIISILDFIMGLSFFFFITILLLQPSKQIIFSINSNTVIFGTASFFAGLASTVICGIFFYLENTEPGSKLLQKILTTKRKIEYKDKSFWGIFVHIAIIILAFTVLFRLIDLPSWQKVILEMLR